MDNTINIARYILDSLDNTSDDKPSTQLTLSALAEKLQIAATSILYPKHGEPVTPEPVISAEIDAKIKFLVECEKSSDLCWMDWVSWCLLPQRMQDKIVELLNPLHWSGVYFSYTDLFAHRDEIYNLLSPEVSLFFLEDRKNYHMIAISSRKGYMDLLGSQDMREFRKQVDRRLIRSVGCSGKGYIVVEKHDIAV